jgi:hypothetical protein
MYVFECLLFENFREPSAECTPGFNPTGTVGTKRRGDVTGRGAGPGSLKFFYFIVLLL